MNVERYTGHFDRTVLRFDKPGTYVKADDYDSLLSAAREAEKKLEHAKSELKDITWPEGGECGQEKDCRICRAEEDITTALARLREHTEGRSP